MPLPSLIEVVPFSEEQLGRFRESKANIVIPGSKSITNRAIVLAALGDEDENGGWAPHVHVQLSWEAPLDGDLPGVVRPENRLEALEKYPDPRLICGPLY